MRESRLGIVISKRILKRAVDRNRFKRIIREYYRNRKNKFANPADIVIRAVEKHNLLETNNLNRYLNLLFQKAGLTF